MKGLVGLNKCEWITFSRLPRVEKCHRWELNLRPTDPEADTLTTQPPRPTIYIGIYTTTMNQNRLICHTPFIFRWRSRLTHCMAEVKATSTSVSTWMGDHWPPRKTRHCDQGLFVGVDLIMLPTVYALALSCWHGRNNESNDKQFRNWKMKKPRRLTPIRNITLKTPSSLPVLDDSGRIR